MLDKWKALDKVERKMKHTHRVHRVQCTKLVHTNHIRLKIKESVNFRITYLWVQNTKMSWWTKKTFSFFKIFLFFTIFAMKKNGNPKSESFSGIFWARLNREEIKANSLLNKKKKREKKLFFWKEKPLVHQARIIW